MFALSPSFSYPFTPQVRYDIKYQVMTTWLFGSETGKVLQIKELKQVALETKDNDYINSLIRDKEANNV